MKNHKSPQQRDLNPQLLEIMEKDLGVNQDNPEEGLSTPQWVPPARPTIPFNSLNKAPLNQTVDPITELYTMYQKTKHLVR